MIRIIKNPIDERIRKLSEAEVGYFAGFFDGDGCVTARGPAPADSSSAPVFIVSVSNTHLGVLQKFSDAFGGAVCNRSKKTEKHRKTYIWQLTGRRAGVFLKVILPYLVVKRKQAELLVKAASLIGNAGRTREKFERVLPHRFELMHQIKELNHV